MNPVDEVRARIDIVELIGERVPLKKAGRTFKACCPFHQERTPSFVVFPESGSWRCFGACGTGGDAFDFIMRTENLPFRDALEFLARRVGVDLSPATPEAKAQVERSKRLRDAVLAAAEHWHGLLLRAPEAEAARVYLSGRGFGTDIAKSFRLGFAPDSWDATGNHLRAMGFHDDDLLAAGLLRERDGGGHYDYFRNRVVIPIHNVRGEPVGFGARALDADSQPKYLNSPQTPIFDKGRTLFALDRARQTIRDSEEAVVVEGYTDVIRAHAAGFTNVVASLGTALTEHHVALLKRFAKRIVLALDADAAGQAATVRGLDVIREAAAGDVVPVPTARGAVRFASTLEVDLRVAVLPAGKDPDDVIRDDPEGWRSLIAGAAPVLGYLLDALTADLDLNDPSAKQTAAERLIPVIADIPDPIVRSAWMARLADKLRVDERALAARMGQVARARTTRPAPRRFDGPAATGDGAAPAIPVVADSGGIDAQGRHAPHDQTDPGQATATVPPPAAPPDNHATRILGFLLAAPSRLAALNEALRAVDEAVLGSEDFLDPLQGDLFEAVRYAAHGTPPPDAPAEQRLDALPEAHARLADTLRRRAVSGPSAAEPTVVQSLWRLVLRLREGAIVQELEALRFEQTEARLEADADGPEVAPTSVRVRELDQRVYQLTAIKRRLSRLLVSDGAVMGKRDRGFG
ncbi:MAG: DNA primase [Ardenticatenales bacterium]|nr:DNA primase [Ardenticatenales bacterium]